MALLPIVERELRVAARKPVTHRVRTVFGFSLAALLTWRLITMSAGNTPLATQGRSVFATLIVLCFIYALFAGVRTTADALSNEKREGTMGLLFLTDLKPVDVVLGKLAANSLNAIYGLVAAIPFLAFPLLMGGVSGAEFLRAGLVLLNVLLLSLSVGIFVSSMSMNERKALFATTIILLVLALGPFGLLMWASNYFHRWFYGVSEVILVGAVLALGPTLGVLDLVVNFGPTRIPTNFIWINQLLLLLMSLLLIRGANRILARSWSDRQSTGWFSRVKVWWNDVLHGTGETRKRFRDRLLDINAFTWLVSRERMKPAYAWGFVICLTVVWLWSWWQYNDVVFDWYPAVPTFLIIHAFAKLWVVSEASHRLVEDQRAGAMELLLSTPMTPERMVQGQWAAFRRQFTYPFIVMCALEWVAFQFHLSRWTILAVHAVFWIDVWALVYMGMWNGLTARNLTQALMRSAGLILFLPWAIFTLIVGPGGLSPRQSSGITEGMPYGIRLALWTSICVGNSLLWGWFAKKRLRTSFREAVLARFAKPREGEG